LDYIKKEHKMLLPLMSQNEDTGNGKESLVLRKIPSSQQENVLNIQAPLQLGLSSAPESLSTVY
jgi:hypothetical protein